MFKNKKSVDLHEKIFFFSKGPEKYKNNIIYIYIYI